ncbi:MULTISPECIES: chromosome partitioning protein ParB [unclassified Variovorax]|uniref:chromosome partitioning protein ParB n=1 Tax=unclassified Variovorax TaxID=663243 RepID=UPI0008ABF1C3|nr:MULTISPECIES: chromosome partitioning protein ParB [unclassified Variovorax]SEJ49674.1 plasmid segregation centromere-binding protein ParG [Variovorax sp. OK202]SFC51447.1 plasmid segregation centromere-binding protein ParG [Variovorax sp. OK212]
MKNGKRVPIGARPPADPQAEVWVRNGDDLAALVRGEVYTARLTLDVTPALRGRIKVAAFTCGITVADMLRALLEREFSEQRP